ncbi:hypothetical protein L2E82_22790 [Cichorium intybus]|uniref:Uncharacterized protein n=1 Tax=Cichorium intybus TaxID=13427 RepID=A0ACB9DYI9_CICIN|nr:hypothetical protein L2E82_22790 [Cichorium intybus]
MLKLLLVGLSKSERGLWAKSNSKVLDFSPSTERRDFRSGFRKERLRLLPANCLSVLVHMLVHRSTESLVIDIRATESPSAERDSFIFLDEDYRELEHDELSPVKTRKITRTMGTMVLFFLQLPQDGFIRSTPLVVRGEPGGNFPDDL